MKYYKNGFYLEQSEQNDRAAISDERWQELLDGQSNGLEIYTKENGEPDLREHVATEVEILESLRARREQECFSIINRGPFWYDSLSLDQKQELKQWYLAWLDVTETKVVPQVSSLLNSPQNAQTNEPQHTAQNPWL